MRETPTGNLSLYILWLYIPISLVCNVGGAIRVRQYVNSRLQRNQFIWYGLYTHQVLY